MIVDMTRYNFLLFHTDIAQFLSNIREVGLVDITTTDWVGSPDQMALAERAEHYTAVAKAMASVVGAGTPYPTVIDAIAAWDRATARMKEFEELLARTHIEADELSVWGEFDPQMVARLKADGVTLRFFEVSTKDFKPEWSYEYPIEVVSQTSAYTYFVVASSEPIDLPAIELKAPTSSINTKLDEIERYTKEQVTIQAELASAALSIEQVAAEAITLREEFNFTKVMTSGTEAADGRLKLIEGWSEKVNTAQIEEFAKSQEVIYFTEAAKEENNPPIKLKNSFFARLFEPIGALYMLPRYNEIDMTPFFAPFFMIFFGMCFGDAGYGILFIVAIVALWKKIPAKFRDIAWLGIFLNIATVAFGMMTGNVFGIELARVPALVEFKEYFVSNDNMFVVAVGLGVVQVLFGQILRIFNRAKRGGSFIYGLSSLGWVILFISSGLYYIDIVPQIAFYILMGIAGFLILFMNSPKKNPFINFGKGLYSVYEQATGVVGDLISYVRLFAIGLAGAIIAQVFNALADGLSGNIPVVSWIVMVAILLIGHAMNIFISILGAFVHPVRLTFVEFFKNAEFDGGGRAFNPFRRIKSGE